MNELDTQLKAIRNAKRDGKRAWADGISVNPYTERNESTAWDAGWNAARNAAERDTLVARLDAMTKRAEAAEARLRANTDELRRLMIDTDAILTGLDPKDIKGAINWGDLGAREVTRVFDADHRTWLRMVIEEVSPGEEQLIAAVRAGLAAKGWDVSNIEIETDW